MNHTARKRFSTAGLWLLALLCTNVSAQDAGTEALPSRLVTSEILETRIQEVEAATGLGEEAKNKLIELHRKALSHLQTATSNAEAAAAYQQAAETASIEAQAIRESMDESNVAAPEATLEADSSTPLRQLESLLQKEKADLGAVDARRADFARRLDEEAGRPAIIRQRLVEAKGQQDEIAARLKLPLGGDEGSDNAEATRWELETRSRALSAEIKMLDQELLSQPARVDLLKAKRDKANASVAWVGERVKILEDLVRGRRQAEADEARQVAEATRLEAEGRHPLVVQLAERNATLTEEIANAASELDELAARTEKTAGLARRLEEDYKAAEETVTIGVYGLSEELGYLLLQQRQTLPNLRTFQRQAKERDEKSGKVGARRLIHRREHKRLSDPQAFVAGMIAESAAEETPSMHKRLIDLAIERKALLEKAVETEDVYLRKLGELESAQQGLLDTIERFDEFLDVHLLWVRSASPAQLRELGALPEQVWRILSPEGWFGAARVLLHQAMHSPVFVLLAVALGALLWGRRHLIGFVEAIAAKLGKPTTDRFVLSLQTLAATLIAAAAWPLVAAVAGWQLKVSSEATDFSSAVGGALLALAMQFYLLRALRLICAPQGLAAAHFRRPESGLRLMRRELDRLSWIYLPALGVTLVAYHLDPLNVGWALGRAAFVVLVAALAFAFYRLLHPASGVLAIYLQRKDWQTFRRLHRLWYPLLVVAPLAMGLLSVLGYVYTAGVLLGLLVNTAWTIVGLVLLAAFAQRWLRVTRRRLAYEAAIERRRALLESREQEGPGAEETGTIDVEEEVDLEDLTDTSRGLINTVIVAFGLVGLWMVWSEALPALRVFDDVILWHQTVSVDGQEQIDAITLADLGLGLIYAIATVLLAKQLPAVLEIVLLDHTEMSAGNRYTVTTLTSYTLITIGLVLVFRTIGADWSKLQWLIAALGVGIGFGLQEIVANFISGVILLFERPIRVGDFVSVADTDGVVTRIRIRATTVRTMDGKELLVPNKAFITGNLLNWSLSDPTTRILISVGIAYGSDVRRAMRLLEEAARENEVVLDDPPPSVIFQAFGDSSLTMLLRCFVDNVDVRFPTISALNQAINDKFNAAGIVIAFPQRDLHMDTTRPLQVELRREKNIRGGDGAGETASG